jgi:hypothetical protein
VSKREVLVCERHTLNALSIASCWKDACLEDLRLLPRDPLRCNQSTLAVATTQRHRSNLHMAALVEEIQTL